MHVLTRTSIVSSVSAPNLFFWGPMMTHETFDDEVNNQISRRRLFKTLGTAVGVAAFAPHVALGQTPGPATPRSVITDPPRDFGPGGTLSPYPDPDLVTVDPRFNQLRRGNTPIKRLWTGALWSEGPAWSSQGRYMVWSDIPNNRQMRYLEDDGRVTVFRSPSNNSNGNTFDFQGTATLVRTLDTACRQVRERRFSDGDCRCVQRYASDRPQRCGAPPGRKLLVYRPGRGRSVV